MNKISLKNYMAEEILKEIYKPREAEKYKKFQEISYEYITTEKILKLYAKAFKAEMDKKAAQLVLDTLSEDKKRLIKLKYGEEKQLVAMSFALNTSVGQLMVWNQSVMEKITQFMKYRLIAEDVFSRKKVIGMVEILSLTVEFFTEVKAGYEIRSEWLEEMERRKNNYQNLLNQLEKFESRKNESSYKKVVLAKIENPNSTNKEIAMTCKLHKATVGRFLKRFTNAMSNYLK